MHETMQRLFDLKAIRFHQIRHHILPLTPVCSGVSPSAPKCAGQIVLLGMSAWRGAILCRTFEKPVSAMGFFFDRASGPCAGIAQLVERNLAKVEVESSRLFSRSIFAHVAQW